MRLRPALFQVNLIRLKLTSATLADPDIIFKKFA